MMLYVFLLTSIVFSSGRNIFSKKLSDVHFGTKAFFLLQGILFLCGGSVLAVFGGISGVGISAPTLAYAAIYGALLILAQWFYTKALSIGKTSLCSTVYSLGFIIPTLSGALFWSESLSVTDVFGILCAVLAIFIFGAASNGKTKSVKSYYFLPLFVATLASGGLGILQKIQQSSPQSHERSSFLFTAFLLASAISFTFALLSKKRYSEPLAKGKITAAAVGFFFGCCNLLNTYLAGKLDSKVFFPTLNIGVILLSTICGFIIFKEKIKKRESVVLILGALSILLLNIG